MKATPGEKPTSFTPICITLETEGEVEGLFAILNRAEITDAVGIDPDWNWPQLIRDANTAAGNPAIQTSRLALKITAILA